MDKYELKVTIGELDSLISRHRFKEAAELADQVDWRRVKNVRTLCRVSDVYKINRRYEDSKRILEMAYAKSPYGRQIIFSLCELELKIGNYVRALQLYNEYINVAPRDSDRYVLQYKLYKAQNVSVNERIAVLEEMAKHDMRDRWCFELAKLYLEAGERQMCASQCDEIIAFFGYGRYVLKALELKATFTELTPVQKALYRKMTGEEEEEIPEPPAAVPAGFGSESAGVYTDAASESGGSLPEKGRPTSENMKRRQNTEGSKEQTAGPAEQGAGAPESGTGTQGDASKAQGAGSEAGRTGEGAGDAAGHTRIVADTSRPLLKSGKADAGEAQTAKEKEKNTDQIQEEAGTSDSEERAKMKADGRNNGQEWIPELNRDHSSAEIPWEYEEYEINSGALKKKPVNKKDKAAEEEAPAVSDAQGKKAEEKAGRTRRDNRLQEQTKSSPDHSVFEDYSFQISSDDEIGLSQESMQKMIAKGMRDLENYDTYLRQETDGQYAMVIQEEPKPEKQITGQLNLEEIMSEWEKVKRNFYEFNGLEEEEPEPVTEPTVIGEKPEKEQIASMYTKSWDPTEVHKALQIRDDDEGRVKYDTSLFVTEGGGEFPEEFAVEKMPDSSKNADRYRQSNPQMYLHSEDSIKQLTRALDRIFLEGGIGNVIITGDEGAGTLSLARELVRRYRRINPNFVGQIAKSEGRYITRENMTRVIPRMPFGALIIERAAMMSEEGAAALCDMIEVPERSILIIMIDRKGVMDAFLNDHPRFREMFPARVDIAALSVETLLGYAREYAGKQQYEIDEYGLSALQSRIMSMQTVEHSVTLEDIRDIVDEAIYYASRKTLSSLVDTFSRRRGGAQNRIVLRDKDFLHY